jgi:peptide/nickel transport system substrate-binding protein
MVKSQGRWVRSLAYGATALLVMSACSQAATPTTAPATTSATTPAPATQAATSAPATQAATPAAHTPGASTPTSTQSAAAETPGTSPIASASTGPTGSTGAGTPQKGGTLYLLTGPAGRTQFDYLDPQLVYTGEDLAFLGATMIRSLVGYKYSSDPAEALTLVPDMATDIGTANTDKTQWSFTLKDGMKWQDGTPVTCADEAYGVSRAFATETGGGPKYAVVYLDIPKNDDGSSQYPGPYTATADQQALFDQAVVCDGNKITFHLNQPVSDFNYTTTLGFGAVSKVSDTGAPLATPMSDGPYMIDGDYVAGNGPLKLKRNPNWDPATDDYRGAYPDNWEVDFALDPQIVDQRVMTSTGNDATALSYGVVQPQDLGAVFQDAQTPNAQFQGRAFSDYDPYVRYYWIRTDLVKNVKIRQAMAVALDRAAIKQNSGGDFVGDLADGVIKPNIGQDYQPTGMWTDMFGQQVPDSGDPDLAKQLITDSGEAAPTLTYDYPQSPVGDQNAAIIKSSLEKAGFTINLNPIADRYYATIFDDSLAHEFGAGGWGPDWPNATTVIPPLFTVAGGWDLSRVNDKDFNKAVAAAQAEPDRAKQAADWQDLNKQAMQNVWVIPTFFEFAQNITGTNVGGQYRWASYGSWPYAQVYVKP